MAGDYLPGFVELPPEVLVLALDSPNVVAIGGDLHLELSYLAHQLLLIQ